MTSTKARNVRSVASMIENHLLNKPIDKLEPMFRVGQEDLVSFKRRRKFQDAYIRMQMMKDMREEVMRQVVDEVRQAGGYIPEEELFEILGADGKVKVAATNKKPENTGEATNKNIKRSKGNVNSSNPSEGTPQNQASMHQPTMQ
jgi:hypothetical protein